MFQIKINNGEEEKAYAVFKPKEFTIITNPKSVFITCPDYYELSIIPGATPIITYTNAKPIIINDNPITETGLDKVNISFGQPITHEEYQILHDLYLEQMKENPTSEYSKEQEIKEDINQAKKLVKKTKRA